MGYFLILDRHKRDMLYSDMYCVYLSDPGQVKRFLVHFCKRNNIKLDPGAVDVSAILKNHAGIHKRRSEHAKKERGSA